MRRRTVLFIAAVSAMIGIAALAEQKKSDLLLLDWASKAAHETPPVAVLIELGLKDAQPTSWSGHATVTGARIVHQEGYRFRTEDKLLEGQRWEASSHRPLRLPANNPALAALEGMATVGVVLQLADVQPDATLTVERKDREGDKSTVSLNDVLAGRPGQFWDGKAVVRLVSTATPVVLTKTEDDFPAAAYGPDGTLWLAYIAYTVRDESRRIEQVNYKDQPANFKALYTPEYADQLLVKSYRTGKWSEPLALTGPRTDLVRCALAVEGDGTVWVAYSAHRQGRHDLFVRPIRKGAPGEELNLTRAAAGAEPDSLRNLGPVMCTDQAGKVWLSCQTWMGGGAHVRVFHREDGAWKGVAGAGTGKGKTGSNEWYPAVAAGREGAAVAHDTYTDGDYDVQLSLLGSSPSAGSQAVAASPRFEARPSLAYDLQGRLWIAYEEGPEMWGKDYGALVPGRGNPLYNERSVRVVCLQDGKLLKPAAELPTSQFKPPTLPFEPAVGNRFERSTRYAYPKIGIDGKGRLWLTYRQKFGSRYSSHPGSYWLSFARRLDGDHWSEPIEIHHADGLLDYRPVLLPHPSGGIVLIHNTDGRYTTPETINNDLYMSVINLPGEPVEPKLVLHEPGRKDPKAAAEERAIVQRIRDYRLDINGKKYQPLRGEFHRHTEISWDGGPDGSLEDMFRYALDAAAMDWIGNGDHDNGAGREYTWWLIQKLTDAYHVKDAFTPMFTYERSVPYPHGHRNCMFVQRGVRTLPRLASEDAKAPGGVHADDTKMLYRYLHEMNGICASHTSATSMGTDWRDNDPQVEPFVEIYQGDRMSYEKEGAPRAGYDPKSGKQPANVAGWFPLGFLDHAFQKGYRLGFESSSDHWSTHISYAIALAERPEREAILDAFKKRRCYGATDAIVVDQRSGSHLMGEEFKSTEAPTLQMNVIGTAPLAQIDILKDSQVVETIKPGQPTYKGSWTDPNPAAGVHYYYIRVEQADKELAWASPMWIDYAR